MNRVRTALDWLVRPDERAAARRAAADLGRDLVVAAAILAVVAGIVVAATLSLGLMISSVGGVGSFVLGWTAMFALTLPTLVVTMRVAARLYTRFGS